MSHSKSRRAITGIIFNVVNIKSSNSSIRSNGLQYCADIRVSATPEIDTPKSKSFFGSFLIWNLVLVSVCMGVFVLFLVFKMSV